MNKEKILIAGILFFILVLATIAGAYLLVSSSKGTVTNSVKVDTSESTEAEKAASGSASFPSFLLQVEAPADGVTVSSASVEVRGRTVPGAEVFVNESQVFPNASGEFKTKVSLTEGENVILVVAGNEEGDSEVERTVYYELQ